MYKVLVQNLMLKVNDLLRTFQIHVFYILVLPCQGITCIVPINNYFFNSCFTWEAYMNWWKMITYATITKLIYTSNECFKKKINLCWKWTNSNCVAVSKETWKKLKIKKIPIPLLWKKYKSNQIVVFNP